MTVEHSYTYQSKALSKTNGFIYQILEDGQILSYAQVIHYWKNEPSFRHFFNGILQDAPYPAFFWEVAPSTKNKLHQQFEFVIIDSHTLTRLSPDIQTFQSYFTQEKTVVSFPNLGKNAQLIVPCPIIEARYYTHLALFVRHAPEHQIDEFWGVIAKEYEQQLGDAPKWLSTAGLGVSWLHIRVDSRPKYYRYKPYKVV